MKLNYHFHFQPIQLFLGDGSFSSLGVFCWGIVKELVVNLLGLFGHLISSEKLSGCMQ